MSFYVGLLFGVLFITICQSLKVIPERVEFNYINKDYVEGAKVNVRRYGRKSDYYVNAEGTLKHTWGNNISVDVILFERLHNEYKRTFIEFHFEQGCNFVDTDPYMGKALGLALHKVGVKCPVPPGFYRLENLTIPADSFPYVWPFERAKAVGSVFTDDRKVFIGNGSLYLSFVQERKRMKKFQLRQLRERFGIPPEAGVIVTHTLPNVVSIHDVIDFNKYIGTNK